MSVRRSSFARVSRGTATFSLAAVLLAAGFITPAQAAEGVPFDPTINVTVPQNSLLGEPAKLMVQIDAEAGDEWTDVGATKAPVTVRVDVYGEYADGSIPGESPTVPVGTTPAASGTFVADNGAGYYSVTTNLDLGAFSYKEGNYTYVASVLTADGGNAAVVNADVSTAFAVPNATTRFTLSPTVTGTLTEPVVTGMGASAQLVGSGFNGQSLEVTSTLYGPYETAPAEAPTAPGGPKVGMTLTTFTGGTTYTQPITVTEPGIYVWYHSIESGQGVPAYAPAFSRAGESFTVLAAELPPITRPVTPGVTDPTPTPPAVTDPTLTDPNSGAGGGGAAGFENCSAALEAGVTDIKSDDVNYVADQDNDKDGVACESTGDDTAVAIDGGFAQVSNVDNTPFIAGGVMMVLLALGLGTTVLVRKMNAAK
jgi:hypothetical protein